MAEVLLSPGVLATETDQSFIAAAPIQAGAAIVGPTAKGPVGIPTLVTTYSDYQSIFGTTVESGSAEYTYFTSISAFNYFQQGGDSLLVTRAVSGSYTSATSTTALNGKDSTAAVAATGSLTIVNSFGEATDDEFQVTVGGSEFRFIAQDPAGGLPVDNSPIFFLATGSNTATYIANLVAKIDAVAIGVDATDAGGTAVELTSSAGGTTGNSISVDTGSGATFDNVLTLEGGIAGVGTGNAFTLKTISEGESQNSYTAVEGANNTLSNGTRDNVRWEIVSPNISTGTFSLLIRRGNDKSNDKTIVETHANLSMDPNSNDYIEKVIGNSRQTVTQDGTDYYVKNEGTYTNRSKYVYVSDVVSPTLNYFDNNGTAKTAFTASIPVASSGSFQNATGTPFTAGNSPAKFYEEINNINSQGFDSDALGSEDNGSYTVALKLLANKDDYQFNVITAPGLIKGNATAASEVSTMVSNAQNRGDNLAIVDLVNWNTNLALVNAGAAGIDSSYAATYWPWLQTIDPDTSKTVWVPASTMVPGVYAFNDRAGEPWFAPAGLNRGGLRTVLRAERKLTNGNRNDLYSNNVNPIATFPNTGVVVFGQKTLQKAASALDRINVRRLLIALKGFISQVADNLVFEQNTAATRNNFLAQVNPYMESVQQRQGLFAFKVVMDDSNNTPDVIDRNQMVGQIFIQPTKTAEFIYLDFNILPTGATFPS
jgi:phage tail sheath protein FI